jgi:hypothetical protein
MRMLFDDGTRPEASRGPSEQSDRDETEHMQ